MKKRKAAAAPKKKAAAKTKAVASKAAAKDEHVGAVAATSSGAAAAASGGSLLSLLVEPEWRAALASEFAKSYFAGVERFVNSAYASSTVFPARDKIFAALNETPLSKVRVVIIGQDPYFNPGQAMGLSFSVPRAVACPPSLKRIYKVLAATVPSFKTPTHGDISEWAGRGVLMLNATLTVESGQANSHSKAGWLEFTKAIIEVLANRKDICFLSWGLFAQKLTKHIDRSRHLIIDDPHPSPMSGAAFLSTTPFTTINTYLVSKGLKPIDWSISA